MIGIKSQNETLSVICSFLNSDKIKRDFFHAVEKVNKTDRAFSFAYKYSDRIRMNFKWIEQLLCLLMLLLVLSWEGWFVL